MKGQILPPINYAQGPVHTKFPKEWTHLPADLDPVILAITIGTKGKKNTVVLQNLYLIVLVALMCKYVMLEVKDISV
jgi:hypothetical protein